MSAAYDIHFYIDIRIAILQEQVLFVDVDFQTFLSLPRWFNSPVCPAGVGNIQRISEQVDACLETGSHIYATLVLAIIVNQTAWTLMLSFLPRGHMSSSMAVVGLSNDLKWVTGQDDVVNVGCRLLGTDIEWHPKENIGRRDFREKTEHGGFRGRYFFSKDAS